KIKVFAYGGDASSTLLTIGKTDLNDLSQLLAESSNIGSGKPISYVVRSLYDNQIVGVQLATQYDVKNCLPSIDPNAPPYTKHWSGLSATFGGIGAGWSVQDDEMILVNQAGDQYMRSR
ncbi:MAG: thiol-activated cytolysin, partial [Bacteroidota bacterium]